MLRNFLHSFFTVLITNSFKYFSLSSSFRYQSLILILCSDRLLFSFPFFSSFFHFYVWNILIFVISNNFSLSISIILNMWKCRQHFSSIDYFHFLLCIYFHLSNRMALRSSAHIWSWLFFRFMNIYKAQFITRYKWSLTSKNRLYNSIKAKLKIYTVCLYFLDEIL